MANKAPAPAPKAQVNQKPPGLFSQLIGLPFKLISIVLLSLLLSIVIEWIGMAFIWPEQGSGHAEAMMYAELDYLGSDFQHGLFKPGERISALVLTTYEFLFVKSGILSFIDNLHLHAQEKSFVGLLASFLLLMKEYLNAAIFISVTLILRLFILTFALPAFLLFMMVGMTDGLVQRDIRRWSGGRESSFVYHLAKGTVRPIIIAPWFIYLALPWSVHPNFIILPFAMMAGVIVWLTSSSFKKYL